MGLNMVKQFAGNLPFCSQGDLMIWEQYDWPMDGMGYLTFRQTPLWNLLAPRRKYMYVCVYIYIYIIYYIYTYTYTCYPPNEQKITYFPPSMLVFFLLTGQIIWHLHWDLRAKIWWFESNLIVHWVTAKVWYYSVVSYGNSIFYLQGSLENCMIYVKV